MADKHDRIAHLKEKYPSIAAFDSVHVADPYGTNETIGGFDLIDAKLNEKMQIDLIWKAFFLEEVYSEMLRDHQLSVIRIENIKTWAEELENTLSYCIERFAIRA